VFFSPTSWSTRPISGPGDASVPLPHWRWMSVAHGCPPLVTGPFLLLLLVPGTVCPNTSRLHLLCLFFGVVWRLFSSGVHSHDIYRNLSSACAVTLSFADTFIVLFSYVWPYWIKVLKVCCSKKCGSGAGFGMDIAILATPRMTVFYLCISMQTWCIFFSENIQCTCGHSKTR